MYKLLFLVHGMGVGARPSTDPTWWPEVVDSLRRSATTYGHADDLVLASPKPGQILIVPITYHTVFDAVRESWSDESPSHAGWLPLLTKLTVSDPAVLTKLPGLVRSAGDFFWTHVLDVLLYRFVSDFTVSVRDEVATQIAEAWHKADLDNGASADVHFLAHSLGTAVLHDAIAVLANEPGFSPNTQLIQSIVSLANVSSVLEHDHPTYISADRPIDAAPPPDGMTSAYFSFRHELDPIANTKTFRGDLNGWPSSGYLDEVPIDVKDWNVHGYTHYLDNPLAHLRLFERLWPREPWRDRRDDAVRKYKAAPGTSCPVAIAQARLELRKLFSHPMPTDPIGFLDVVARTVVVLDDARQACQRETP